MSVEIPKPEPPLDVPGRDRAPAFLHDRGVDLPADQQTATAAELLLGGAALA